MATTYPETARISQRPAAIRVSLPPTDEGRRGVSARVFGPYTETPSAHEQLHKWLVVGGVVATVAIGILAWPGLVTVGDAILYLVP